MPGEGETRDPDRHDRRPRRSRALDRDRLRTLAAEEYARFGALLRELSPDDWSRQTDCDRWDVADLLRHVVGAMHGNASFRELAHQMRAERKEADPVQIDRLGVVQVRDRASRSVDQLLDRYDELAPRAVRRRFGMPAPIRRVKIPVELPSLQEKWTLGFLLDVIYTRDTWMHRVDVCSCHRSASRFSTPDHDGVLVADVVAEWARRHGQPVELTLTGPAGSLPLR
ncbi:MAG: maleylpyruvate isomerase family mycothiol-dependent enzyme [Acidimicrobiia bacterium]|nr:maleylpyruvate isomerase family mycothiol-dependent enzyme [Acidimicrobiia bacterium]